MLRGLLALFFGAMLPLAAWELPGANELAALYGQEPMLSIASAGIPLPPTRDEVPGLQHGRQAFAIKQALTYQISLAKAERRRVSLDNYRATSLFARKAGAPRLFSCYQDLLAGNELSPREDYQVNRALNLLIIGGYGVDALQLRLLSESLELPATEHTRYLLQLPKAALAEQIAAGRPSAEDRISDFQMMSQVLQHVNAELGKVTNQATADAAAANLLAHLPLWNTALRTRVLIGENYDMTPAEKQSIDEMFAMAELIGRTRAALAEKEWYQSPRLRFVDSLFR